MSKIELLSDPIFILKKKMRNGPKNVERIKKNYSETKKKHFGSFIDNVFSCIYAAALTRSKLKNGKF